MYKDYRTRGIEYPNLEEFMNTPDEYFMLGELFAQDAEARGAYVAPTEPTIQVFNNKSFRPETTPSILKKSGSEATKENRRCLPIMFLKLKC